MTKVLPTNTIGNVSYFTRKRFMLKLSEGCLEQMKLYAERSYPEECAGIILGTHENGARKVVEILPVTNTAQSPKVEFSISDSELLLAEKAALSQNLDVVGIYHSHADFAAVASGKDRMFALPALSYPIVQVAEGKAETVRSYAFDGGFSIENFSEEEIVCL